MAKIKRPDVNRRHDSMDTKLGDVIGHMPKLRDYSTELYHTGAYDKEQKEYAETIISEEELDSFAKYLKDKAEQEEMANVLEQQLKKQKEQEILETGSEIEKEIVKTSGLDGLKDHYDKRQEFNKLESKLGTSRHTAFTNNILNNPYGLGGLPNLSGLYSLTKPEKEDSPIIAFPKIVAGTMLKGVAGLAAFLPTAVTSDAARVVAKYTGLGNFTTFFDEENRHTLNPEETKRYKELKKEIDTVQAPVLERELQRNIKEAEKITTALAPMQELIGLENSNNNNRRNGITLKPEEQAKKDKRIAELKVQFGVTNMSDTTTKLKEEIALLEDIEYFHKEAAQEYENALKQEVQSGWTNYWTGFTEDRMSIASVMQGVRGMSIDKKISNKEELTPIEKTWLDSRNKMIESKEGGFNTSEGYKLGKSVRHSAEFIAEVFTTRGLGKAVGSVGKAAGVTAKMGTVGNLLSSPLGMSKTYTMAMDKKLGAIEKVGLPGEEEYMNSDKAKQTFLKKLDGDIIEKQSAFNVLDKKFQDPNYVINDEELADWSRLGKELNQADAVRQNLVDEEGNLRKGEWNLAEAIWSGYTENLIENFTERIGGKFIDKGLSSVYSKIGKVKPGKWVMDSKLGRWSDNVTGKYKEGLINFEKNKYGKLTSELWKTTGPNKVINSLPAEVMEEWIVQMLPSYREDYIKKMSELANPEFHIDVLLQTALIGGKFSTFGTAKHYMMRGASADYRKNYDDFEAKKLALKENFRAVDKSITDDEAAKHIAMAVSGTNFNMNEYSEQIALLRDPEAPNLKGLTPEERESKAKLLEEKQFINAALLSVQTGSEKSFKSTLAKMSRNKKLSEDMRQLAQKTMDRVDTFSSIIEKNRDLDNGQELIGLEIRKNLLQDNKKTLDGLVKENRPTIENLLSNFLKNRSKDTIGLTVDNLLQPDNLSEEQQSLAQEFFKVNTDNAALNRFFDSSYLREHLDFSEELIDTDLEYENNPKNRDEIKKRRETQVLEGVKHSLKFSKTLENLNVSQSSIESVEDSAEKTEILNQIEVRKKEAYLTEEQDKAELETLDDARTKEEILSDDIVELKKKLAQSSGRNIDIVAKQIQEKQNELDTLNKATQTTDSEQGGETQMEEAPEFTPEDFEGFEGFEEFSVETTEAATNVMGAVETVVSDTSVDTETQETTEPEYRQGTTQDVGDLMSRFQDDSKGKVPKDTVDNFETVVGEVAEKLGKGVENVTFPEVLAHFKSMFGKERVKSNFDKLALVWEATGRDELTPDYLGKIEKSFFTPAQEVIDTLETLDFEYADKVATDSVDAEHEKTDPVIKPNPITETHERDSDLLKKDKRTDKSDTKLAHKNSKGVRIDDTNWTRPPYVPGNRAGINLAPKHDRDPVQNRLILDKQFMYEAGKEVGALSVKVHDVDSIPQGDSMTWGEVKRNKQQTLGKDTAEYKQWYEGNVPIYVRYKGAMSNNVPVFISAIHSADWYVPKNVQDADPKIAKEGKDKITALRKAYFQSGQEAMPINITKSSYGNIDRIRKEDRPIPISESNPQSSLGVLIRDPKTKEFVVNKMGTPVSLDNMDTLREVARQQGVGSLAIFIAPVHINEDGTEVLHGFPVMSNNPNTDIENLKGNTDPRIVENMRIMFMADSISSNRNNKDVLEGLTTFFKQELGLNEKLTSTDLLNIVDNINKQVKKDIGTTAIGKYLSMFIPTKLNNTKVDTETGQITKQDTVGVEHHKNHEQVTFTGFNSKNEKKSYQIGGELVDRTKDKTMTPDRLVAAFASNYRTVFGENGFIHNTTPYLNNTMLREKESTVSIYTVENGVPTVQNDAPSYEKFMQSILLSNIVSHEIQRLDGTTTWAIDVQPMVYFDLGEVQKTKQNKIVAETNKIENKEEVEKVEVQEEFNNSPELLTEWKQVEDKVKEDFPLITEGQLSTIKRQFTQKSNNNVEVIETKMAERGVLKSNQVVGLSSLEQQQLVQMLKNSIINGLDLTGNLKEQLPKAIENSLGNHVSPLLDTAEVLDTIYKQLGLTELAEVNKKNANKLRSVFAETERPKIVGNKGVLYEEFTSLLNEDVDNFEQDDVSEPETFGKHAAEKDIQLSFSAKLKLSLFGIEKFNIDGSKKVNSMGIQEYYEAQNILERLLEITTEIPSDEILLLAMLDRKRLSLVHSNNPLHTLYRDLTAKYKSLPEGLRNQILHKTISKRFNAEKTMLREMIKEGVITSHQASVIAEGLNFVQKQFNVVANDFINTSDFIRLQTVEIEQDGEKIETLETVLNLEHVDAFLPELLSFISKYGTNNITPTSEVVTEIVDMLNQIGITQISEFGVEAYLEAENKLPSFFQGFYSTLVDVRNNQEKSNNIEENNPIRNLHGMVKELLKYEMFANGVNINSSVRVGDKTLQGIIANTSLADINQSVTSEHSYQETLENYLLAPENKDNTIFNLLLQDKDFRQSFSKFAFSSPSSIGVQGKQDSDRANIDEISPKDIFLAKFGQYTSVAVETKELSKTTAENLLGKTGLNFRIGKMSSHTLADKGRLLFMSNALLKFTPNKEIAFDTNGDIVLSDTLLDYLTQQIFESDLAKIKQVLNNGTGLSEYQDMATLFQTIPSLNGIQLSFEGNNYTLPQYLVMTKGVILDAHKETIYKEVKDKISKYVKNDVDKKISKEGTSGELVNSGLYTADGKLLGVDARYVKEYEVGKEGIDKLKAIRTVMAEFTINTALHNKLTHSLYLGDISFYGKKKFLTQVGVVNKDGAFESVLNRDTGVINYEMLAKPQVYQALNRLIGAALDKRTASLIAPGSPLANASTKTKGIATSIVHIGIKDSERASTTYLNIPGYGNMNVADAQEYTTWRTHLDILYRKGEYDMTKEQYQRIKSNIEAGKKLTEEDSKVFFQPIKPVYSGIIPHKLPDGSVVMRPVYNKSSSFPLLPEVIANTELDAVRKKLEALEFDGNGDFRHVRASYQSANKIGSMATKLTFEQLASDSMSEIPLTLLDSAMTILPMSGYKIQQENPSKEMKAYKQGKDAYITMGSQFMKMIMGDFINHSTKPIFPNTFGKDILQEFGVIPLVEHGGLANTDGNLTGQQLDTVYNKIYFKFSDTLRQGLEEELGLSDIPFKDLSVKEQNKVYTNLQEIIEKEVKERGYPNYLTKVVQLIRQSSGELSTINPLFFDSNTHKFESLLHAIIANRVITHKLPGNGHIVGSSEGFRKKKSYDDLTSQERAGIVYVGDVNKDNLAPTFITENGKLVKAQVLIPSHFKYTDANGVYKHIDLSSDEYSENITDKITGKIVGRRLLTERFDKELLSMFSYRIPTSSLQSGAIIEVIGFLPNSMGDLLVVPAEHGIQLGEDFDIDKRFVYKNNYYIDEKGDVKKLNYDKAFLTEVKEAAETLKESIDSIGTETGQTVTEIFSKFQQTNQGINQQVLVLMVEEMRVLSNVGFKQNKQGNISNIDKIVKNIEMKMVENVLIDVYKSVFSTEDASIQNAIRTPLETEIAEQTSFAMYDMLFGGSVDPDASIMSDSFQTSLILLGADGKGGIGVQSNAVTFEAQLQRLVDKILTGDLTFDFKTGEPIFKPFTLNIFKQEFNGKLGENKYSFEGSRTITAHHAENQNVSTDNINKQIMAKRNENSFTMSVFAFMAHMGIDKSIQEVQMSDREKAKIHLPSVFMNQPILRRYVEIMKQFESVTADFVNPKEKLSKVLEQLGSEFNFDVTQGKDKLFTTPDFNNSALSDISPQQLWNMLPDVMGKSNGNVQKEILYTFLEMEKHTKMLGEIQQLFNISTNKLGVSHFETLQKLEVLDKIGDIATQMQLYPESKYNGFDRFIGEVSATPKIGFEKVGNFYWRPTTNEGKMLINALVLSDKIMPVFFPYAKPAMSSVVNSIFSITDKDVSSKSKSNLKHKFEIMSAFKDFISASPGLYKGDINSERRRLFFNYPGNQALGSILSDLKAQKNPIVNNRFIKDLEVSTNRFTNMVLIKHTAQESSTLDKSTKYDDFTALLNDNSVLGVFNGETLTVAKFAEDLASYAYLADGQNGATGFKNFVNVEYVELSGMSKTYRDTFKDLLQKDDLTDQDIDRLQAFRQQYIQHYPNRAMVLSGRTPKQKAEAIKELLDQKEKKPMPDYISFRLSKPRKNSGVDREIKPYELYKYNEHTHTYDPIDVLGVSGYNEYNPNTNNEVGTLIKRVVKNTMSVPVAGTQIKSTFGTIYETVGPNKGKIVNKSTGLVIDFKTFEEMYSSFDTVDKLGAFFKKERLSEPTTGEKTKEFILLWHDLMDNLTLEAKATLDAVKIVWHKDTALNNKYSPSDNTIYLRADILEEIALPKSGFIFDNAINIVRDVVIEEVVHATTAHAIVDYYAKVEVEGTTQFVLRNDIEIPAYVKDLNAAYEAAAKVLPYDPNNPQDSNYFSKDIYEFVAGFLGSPEYRAKLEKEAPNLVAQMLKALEKLFRYITGDISYTNTTAKAIKDLLDNKYKSETVATTSVPTARDKMREIQKDDPVDPIIDKSRSLDNLDAKPPAPSLESRFNNTDKPRLPSIKNCK